MTTREQIINSLSKFLAKCKSTFAAIANIVDNCASTSTTMPLSANQGKVLQDQITELNTKLSINNSFSIKCFPFVVTSDSGGYINIPYNGENLSFDSCAGLFVCAVQSHSYIKVNNCFLNSNNIWRCKLMDNNENAMIDKTINLIAVAFIKNEML